MNKIIDTLEDFETKPNPENISNFISSSKAYALKESLNEMLEEDAKKQEEED
jgi:hypothetical protein